MSSLSTTQAGKVDYDRELTVIYAPCDAETLAEAIDATVKSIAEAEFEVCSMDIDRKKVLAYPIHKEGKEYPQGIFAYFTLRGTGSATRLSGRLDVGNQVLRYLLVTVDKRKLKEYK